MQDLTFKINSHLKDRRLSYTPFTDNLISDKFCFGFKKNNPQYINKTKKDIIEDWKKIADSMINIVINEPDGLKMDNNMGELRIGLIHKSKILDSNLSSKIGKPVKFLNYHTNRKPGKLVWKTEYARIVHFFLRYIGFGPERSVKLKVHNAFLNRGNTFKDVTDNYKFIK